MFGLVLQLSIRIKKNYDHLLDNLNSNFNNFYIILKPRIFHPPYFTSLGGGVICSQVVISGHATLLSVENERVIKVLI